MERKSVKQFHPTETIYVIPKSGYARGDETPKEATIMAAKANETTTTINTNPFTLSPAQQASGAHNGITPSPYKLLQQLFVEGYLDDHRGWFGSVDASTHLPNVALIRTDLRNGAVEVCFATDDARGFSINPFYVSKEDGRIHLSTWSVGGTIRLYNASSLEQAVNDANKEALTNPYDFTREILTVVRRDEFIAGLKK